MNHIRLTRRVRLPDRLRVERCRQAPSVGPRIVFFSGGTALKRISKRLIDYTHNSAHIITPFDSGGSSALLRKAFGMISVGDIRNRLMALADQSVKGAPDVYRLFGARLPISADNHVLHATLNDMCEGREHRVAALREPMQSIIRHHLRYFRDGAGPDFDLRGANIGNLILAGGWLNNAHEMEAVIFLFSRLAEVRGWVRPSCLESADLAAELADGSVVVGQHNISGKEVEPLTQSITRLWLARSLKDPSPVEVQAPEAICDRIRKADLIVYPPGSLYTSVLANLLPQGVLYAIADAGCPKVYLPGTFADPEQAGLTLADSVRVLSEYLTRDGHPLEDMLDMVLIDSAHSAYSGGADNLPDLAPIVDIPLIREDEKPFLDPTLLIETLLSLA